jgi:Zn-finger nucleic acid-binding protein
MSMDVQCPAGCGSMEYKTNRNLKVRVFEPIGYALMIGGLPFIVGHFDAVPLPISYVIGFGMLMLGAYRTALVTTDLSCNTCTGVILESKSIDQRLKGDAFGLALNKAKYVRDALSTSTQDSEYDCPDCGKKMSYISVPLEDGSHRPNHLVPDIVETIQNLETVSRTVDLDGCKECDLLWFNKANKEKVISRDNTIIVKT